MARRKRLTPAQPGYLDGPGPETGARASASGAGPKPLGPAPIAQVAGDAATRAALEEMSRALAAARTEGRMIERLPLSAIDETHLVRDRLVQDDDEMAALVDSLRARGQQTAIEVVRLPDGTGGSGGPAYGLISGWRRLTALKRLYAETSDPKFAQVEARIVAPETAQAAYVAMVEENEIRADLSFYERARIAVQAMREGVYADRRAALQGLYGATTRSRRSKIGSFIALVEALDGDLKHPAAISEKLGLALVQALGRDPEFVSELRNSLESRPDREAAEEIRILAAALADAGPAKPPRAAAPRPHREPAGPGIAVAFDAARGRIELTGPRVDADLHAALRDWLAGR